MNVFVLIVLATVKAYRTVQRARGESGDTNEFDERVKAAGYEKQQQKQTKQNKTKKQKLPKVYFVFSCLFSYNNNTQNIRLRLVESFAITGAMAHMAWPALVAFSLGLKRWGHVLVNGLAEVKPNSDAWDRLVLPKVCLKFDLAWFVAEECLVCFVFQNISRKKNCCFLWFKLRSIQMLLACVIWCTTKAADHCFFCMVFLAQGKYNHIFPFFVYLKLTNLIVAKLNFSKTLTVEALAEKYAVPCYYLTFGELGTSVKELEATMGDVLALCSGWGALVLLDEGDALVERREKVIISWLLCLIIHFLNFFVWNVN